MNMKRREFLKNTALTAGSLFISQEVSGMGKPAKESKRSSSIPKRTLGKTGERLSVIGFGGIVVMDTEPAYAAEVVAKSVERGINYFDVAPTYGDAEIKLGPALKPYRDKVFLACKTHRRDKAGAKENLDESLKRLETDHFDLYQLHGLVEVEKDVKAALAKDGAIQTILEAKKAGIIRHIGFSAHSVEAAMTAMQEFDFDTILYPINFCCHYQGNFDQQVIAEAQKRNMGILALKAMAMQKWQAPEDKEQYPKCWYEPIDDPRIAQMAVSWTLSQPVTAALPPGQQQLFLMALDFANRCGTINSEETAELETIAKACDPIFTA